MLIHPDRGNTIKAVLSMNKFITGSQDYFAYGAPSYSKIGRNPSN